MWRTEALVKGERPYDKTAVEADVAIIEMMSKLPLGFFPAQPPDLRHLAWP